MKLLQFLLLIVLTSSSLTPADFFLDSEAIRAAYENPKPEWQRKHTIKAEDFDNEKLMEMADVKFPLIMNTTTSFGPTYLTRIGWRLAVFTEKLKKLRPEQRVAFSVFFDESAAELRALIDENKDREHENDGSLLTTDELIARWNARCDATEAKTNAFYKKMNHLLEIQEKAVHKEYRAILAAAPTPPAPGPSVAQPHPRGASAPRPVSPLPAKLVFTPIVECFNSAGRKHAVGWFGAEGEDKVLISVVGGGVPLRDNFIYINPDYPFTALPDGLFYWEKQGDVENYSVGIDLEREVKHQPSLKGWKYSGVGGAGASRYTDGASIWDPSKESAGLRGKILRHPNEKIARIVGE